MRRGPASRRFEVFDTDGSGTLSPDELKAILTMPVGGRPAQFTEEQVDDLVRKYDSNGGTLCPVDAQNNAVTPTLDRCRAAFCAAEV